MNMVKKSIFKAAGVSLALALTLSCSGGNENPTGSDDASSAVCEIRPSAETENNYEIFCDNKLAGSLKNGENDINTSKDGVDGNHGKDGTSCRLEDPGYDAPTNAAWEVFCGNISKGYLLNGTSCNAMDFDTHVEIKCGNDDPIAMSKFNLCDGKMYNLTTHFCDENGEVAPLMCDGKTYNLATQFCFDDKIYGKSTHGFCDGEIYAFATKFCDPRDNYLYKITSIGDQTWFAENLRYSKNNTMGLCAMNSEENCDKYGRMYTLDEQFCSGGSCEEVAWGVADPNALKNELGCPAGWHLPNTVEAERLWTHADPNFVPGSEGAGTGRNSAGTKLKAKSGWNSGNGTDDFGFAALPGSYCGGGCSSGPSTSQVNSFLGTASYWWTHAHGAPVPLAKSHRINTAAVVDDAYQSYSTSRFYTRCLKNSVPTPKTPESMPQTIACAGEGEEGQKCHYGNWKNYFTDDRDGKEYPYVEIGGKKWMAANLNYNAATGSACYNNLDANCNIFGRLYNLETAVNNACPANWRVPTAAEWTALSTAAGGASANIKLKAKSGWDVRSTDGSVGINGDDDYGFAALPGGYGVLNKGNIGDVVNFGTARGAFWWTNAAVAANGATIRHIGPTSAFISVDNDKSRLYSVRCISDL